MAPIISRVTRPPSLGIIDREQKIGVGEEMTRETRGRGRRWAYGREERGWTVERDAGGGGGGKPPFRPKGY